MRECKPINIEFLCHTNCFSDILLFSCINVVVYVCCVSVYIEYRIVIICGIMVLKPIWMYGLELWGCASVSNTAIIQRYQAKILRIITNAPRFVTNLTLHTDLRIPQVRSVFKQWIEIHRTALESHPNPLIEPILAQHNRRLKRRWTFDELT